MASLGKIECDGDYWHSLEKAVEKDKRRDSYMLEHRYKILRLPEYKIRSGEYLMYLEEILNG